MITNPDVVQDSRMIDGTKTEFAQSQVSASNSRSGTTKCVVTPPWGTLRMMQTGKMEKLQIWMGMVSMEEAGCS